MAKIYDFHIKMNPWDNFICDCFFGRKIPRNVYESFALFLSLTIAAVALPILWGLMHIPFIWPESLAGFVAVLIVLIGIRPYQDYFRSLIVLIVAGLFLKYHVTFNAEIWGFHIETYLYYIAIVAAVFTLWRRFLNWFVWKNLDRICEKYEIPKIDQKQLMDSFEGYDTHYGEKKVKYATYKDAIAAAKQCDNNVIFKEK